MRSATVPAESVDPRLTASLAGFVGGVGEVLGGVLSPSLAGWLAERLAELLQLPDDTRLLLCHDYRPGGRPPQPGRRRPEDGEE